MNDQLLSHLGYTGSAEVSLEDDCLYGTILFISDLVTYEAETVPGLRKAFEEAVEFYLAQCAEMGLPANAPLNGGKRQRA